jgi:hypothetical protein
MTYSRSMCFELLVARGSTFDESGVFFATSLSTFS